ncbi:hypothetical protein ZIOFF_022130 [Zingiber officinale]|uniref:Uncharacterized protein n=1 Tax=Zingiber officinale TaxID=94328 RepID=A0A8J5HJQ6_ZINOF|nr:hypothetical protein ZIOFF_022130 [Zingiber officinale]
MRMYPANLSQDEVQQRAVKSSDSCFAGLIKKSFWPFNQSLGHSGSRVSVNGYPISDHSTKKAEKLAGSIAPGNYRYNYRAGFWGVIGHQCLGMIPIKFNYPMPKNCAGGDTDIVMNGRELHPKGLELLVGRGLPTTRGAWCPQAMVQRQSAYVELVDYFQGRIQELEVDWPDLELV